MKWNLTREHEKSAVAILWFLVVMCGIAYAQVPSDAPSPMPGISGPGQTAKETATYQNMELGLGSRQMSNLNNAVATTLDHTNDMHTVQEHNAELASQLDAMNVKIAGDYIESPATASAQAQLILINQAAEEVYAAADDVGTAMALAIIHKYEGLTHEEAVALYVDELRQAGFLPERPKFSKNDKQDFTFISKAFAATGGGDRPEKWLGVKAKGHPSDIGSFQNDMTMGGPANGDPSRIALANTLEQGEGQLIDGLPGRIDESDETATIQGASDTAHREAIGARNGGVLTKVTDAVAWNSTANSRTTGDNSDHSSFFISKAYAAANPNQIDVTGTIKTYGQAMSKWCGVANPNGVGVGCCKEGNGQCQALGVQNAMKHDLASSMDMHSLLKAGGASKNTETTNLILSGDNSSQWSPQ